MEIDEVGEGDAEESGYREEVDGGVAKDNGAEELMVRCRVWMLLMEL